MPRFIVKKKVRPTPRMVLRSVSRALRGNHLTLRDLSLHVLIARNHDLERMILVQRNVRRNRRVSESQGMPAQNNQPIPNRRNSVSDSINNSLAVQQPIVPLDAEFVDRLNMIIEGENVRDESNLAENDEMLHHNQDMDKVVHKNDAEMLLMQTANEAIDEDLLLKTPERVVGGDDATAMDIDEEILLKTPEDVIESKDKTVSHDSCSKKPFKPLPAPFHVRGRRPSTGCNKMAPIAEQ